MPPGSPNPDPVSVHVIIVSFSHPFSDLAFKIPENPCPFSDLASKDLCHHRLD